MRIFDPVKIANLLPPIFIVTIIALIWSTYGGLHLLPMWARTSSECMSLQAVLTEPMLCRSIWHGVISQTFSALLVVCYARCLLTRPGSIPSTADWQLGGKQATVSAGSCTELKESGERRHCKWCLTFKPDRCHHCRICGSCVLRMDHHCPWIMNCVGFRNHKYFILLVFYAVMSTCFIGITVFESVERAVMEETLPNDRFMLVLCLVLCSLMGLLMLLFFGFHIWLMLQGMTTIEFCEKACTTGIKTSNLSGYDAGVLNNVQNVLGPNPLLWLLPCSPPQGDGIFFEKKRMLDELDPEWTGTPH